MQHLANVVGELAKAPIWVDDSPGLTILELRAKARRLKLQHDIKLHHDRLHAADG
jgi:replicative DNA helicase